MDRAQIEREVRAQVATEIRKVGANMSGYERPRRHDAETPTDFANDFEWAAMIAEGAFPT